MSNMQEEIDRLRAELERMIESDRIRFELVMSHGQEIHRLKDLVTRAKPWVEVSLHGNAVFDELNKEQWIADFKKEIGG